MDENIKNDRLSSHCLDIATPYLVPLSAYYKRSNSYYSLKNRLPQIITGVLNNLQRIDKSIVSKYGEEALKDIELIIENIERFLLSVDQNAKVSLFKMNDSDVADWNEAIMTERSVKGCITFYTARSLFSECYFFRKINEICERCEIIKNFDLFQEERKLLFTGQYEQIVFLGNYFMRKMIENLLSGREEIKKGFLMLIKMNICGIQYDIMDSILDRNFCYKTEHCKEIIEYSLSNLLIDHSENIWIIVSCPKLHDDVVAFITGKAGYDLFSDCCLADFMITFHLCKSVHFYVKTMPWFVLDALAYDLRWLIKQLLQSNRSMLKKLGFRWRTYLNTNIWIIVSDNFFTLPYSYDHMNEVRPNLYKTLKEKKLVIFKGDLNYRKLVGDINWHSETSFHEALRGFHPGNICSLRRIEYNVLVGVKKDVVENLNEIDPEWMTSGSLAVIEYDGDLSDF